jgi:drug/metabolite transporter (DMT)-like permease
MPDAVHRPMTAAEWALLGALSLLWGGSFLFAEVALRELPPFTLVALRVGLAAVMLHAILAARGGRMPRGGRAWAAFLTMGALNNALPFCLIVWGQTQIASGLAAILNATTPLWTVLLAHFLTRDERMTPQKACGVLVGFAGVAVMLGPALLAGMGAGALARFAVLAAAVSYALAGIYGRRFAAMGLPPLVTAAGQVTASALVLVPLAIVVDRPWELALPEPATVAAVLGLAMLSTALAYLLYFRLLASAGATNLLLVTLLIPVSAILLGALLLGERVAPGQLLGMALIGSGLAAIDGRPLRKLSRLARA